MSRFIIFSVLSCVCLVSPCSAYGQSAADLLQQARRYDAAGDTLNAAIRYTEVIDQFPQSAECVSAYNDFVAMAEDHEGGVIPQTVIDAYSAHYPSIDAVTSPEAKWVIIEHYSYEMMLAFGREDVETGAKLASNVRNQCRTLFETFPNNQVAIGAVQRYTEMSRALDETAQDEAKAVLEGLIAQSDPSAARWAARFTLAWHLELTGGDRQSAKAQYKALTEESQLPFFQQLVANPHPLYFLEVDVEYALGDAHLRRGNHDEAIVCFDRAASYSFQGKPTEMADYKAAFARHMKNPEDVVGAITRYEAHLQAYPESDRRAHTNLHLGKLEEQRGRPLAAIERYKEARDAGVADTVTQRAQERINSLSRN